MAESIKLAKMTGVKSVFLSWQKTLVDNFYNRNSP